MNTLASRSHDSGGPATAAARGASRWHRLPQLLRVPYELWVSCSAVALFCVGGLCISALAFALHFVLPRESGRRFGRRLLMALFRFFTGYLKLWGLFKLDIEAVDRLADEEGLIIAPNHISLWDVVFIISRLPNVVCIAKASVMRNPVYGGFARLAGFIPNDHPAGMVKAAAAELRAGAQLLVFPEGTRTVRPPINRFKGGFALVAKKAGAPIQTLLISANSAFLGKTWPLFKRPEYPYRYQIRLGGRFELTPDIDTKPFLDTLHRHFRESLPDDPRRDA